MAASRHVGIAVGGNGKWALASKTNERSRANLEGMTLLRIRCWPIATAVVLAVTVSRLPGSFPFLSALALWGNPDAPRVGISSRVGVDRGPSGQPHGGLRLHRAGHHPCGLNH